MTERLSIRKFGPIQEADIEVRDLTIFVGPQATGKSMAAQLLYFMNRLEDLLPLTDSANKASASTTYRFETPATEKVVRTLDEWLGNPTSVYVKLDSLVGWEESSQADSYTITWSADRVALNFYLEEWVHRFDEHQLSPTPPQLYIPAGRSLYSFVPPEAAALLRNRSNYRLDWPGYIQQFSRMLNQVIKSLWEYQQSESREQLTLLDFPLSPFIKKRISEILKGEIRYGPGTIALTSDAFTLRPETIAAGQMEAWPFLAIIEDAAHQGTLESLRIFFEEPEAHLHPKAQQKMMEIVAALVRGGTQLIITTHSPYILYALNNFLTVGEVLGKGRTLPPGISPELALLPQQVAAYCFGSDGHITDIMDRELGLIDSQELSKVAEELGSDFTAMQEQLLDEEPDKDA